MARSCQGRTARLYLFYERMLPMIACCTPDPYAFSVCKHLLHWKGIFDSPLVRPPYLNAPEWLQRELRAGAAARTARRSKRRAWLPLKRFLQLD